MNKETLILFFELEHYGKTQSRGEAKPTNLPPRKDLSDVMVDLKELIKSGHDCSVSKPNNKRLSLVEINEDEEHFFLLVNSLEGDNKNLVTTSMATPGPYQTINLQDKGILSSSHIVIEKHKGALNKYQVLFEKSGQLPFKDYASLLNKLLRDLAQVNKSYLDNHFDGTAGKKMKVYSCFNFSGWPSTSFISELNSSTLSGLDIIAEANELSSLDQGSMNKVTKVQVSLSTTGVSASIGNFSFIKNNSVQVAKQLKSNRIRVSFKNNDGDTKSAFLDQNLQLIDKDKFVKRMRLPNSSNTETGYHSINQDIIDSMLTLK